MPEPTLGPSVILIYRISVFRLSSAGVDWKLSLAGLLIGLLVGMTGMPEAGLARELGLSYASLCVVANWAAGCDPADTEISLEEVLANVESVSGHLLPILERLLEP